VLDRIISIALTLGLVTFLEMHTWSKGIQRCALLDFELMNL
jgi:hypothetical protein